MDVVLEGDVIFTAVGPELEFRGQESSQKLVQATESGNINVVEECELLISGVGQRSQFGESTRRIKCGLWQRTATGIGEARRDRRTSNGQMNCSPRTMGKTANRGAALFDLRVLDGA
jgi:hypothetical protein